MATRVLAWLETAALFFIAFRLGRLLGGVPAAKMRWPGCISRIKNLAYPPVEKIMLTKRGNVG